METSEGLSEFKVQTLSIVICNTHGLYSTQYYILPVTRPPLSKKLFPVRWVTPKKASREVGIFFFLISFLYKLECTGRGGGGEKKKFFWKKKEKILLAAFRSSRPVDRKRFFYLRMAPAYRLHEGSILVD